MSASIPSHQQYHLADLNCSDDLVSERAQELRRLGIPAVDEPRDSELVPVPAREIHPWDP